MTGPADFTKFVPGFEFFQGLMKNAGQSIPHMGQWIAPTLDPEELSKRIEQLKTVQFWLEQNAKLLGTTIQALEVQRMTLSTLKNMNVPVEAMGEAFKMGMPGSAGAQARTAAFTPPPAPEPAPPARKPRSTARKANPQPGHSAAGAAGAAGSVGAAPGVDPLQWWGALTQQFTELAAQALKDPAGATRNLADQAMKTATAVPAGVRSAVKAKARGAVRRRKA